jgi:hypothetical protein
MIYSYLKTIYLKRLLQNNINTTAMKKCSKTNDIRVCLNSTKSKLFLIKPRLIKKGYGHKLIKRFAIKFKIFHNIFMNITIFNLELTSKPIWSKTYYAIQLYNQETDLFCFELFFSFAQERTISFFSVKNNNEKNDLVTFDNSNNHTSL